jgi:hypothetical protein
MTNVERTNAELRATLIVVGKRIVKLNFGPPKRHLHRLLTRRRSAAKSAHSRPVRQNRDSRVASMSETAVANTITITRHLRGLRHERKDGLWIGFGH